MNPNRLEPIEPDGGCSLSTPTPTHRLRRIGHDLLTARRRGLLRPNGARFRQRGGFRIFHYFFGPSIFKILRLQVACPYCQPPPVTTLRVTIKASFYGSSCAENGKGTLNTPEP
eukprot:881694-Prorocentrum_minimum.AAC.1